MFGETEILPLVVFTLSGIAIVTDLWRGRIYNWLTLPAILLGLIFNFFTDGLSGFGVALASVAFAFVIYGWMFWLGVMGGGDVKLLMALGAWCGFNFVFDVALLGIVLGGAMAIGILIYNGKIVDFFKRMHHFLLTVFIKELEFEAPKINHKLTMPFGLAIAAAAIWVVIYNPVLSWGLHPWK